VLSQASYAGFIPVRDAAAARDFCVGVLGLRVRHPDGSTLSLTTPAAR
jgi:catechol 2,3-dioxygenase-like lactoylglutathione lyase family enzyme